MCELCCQASVSISIRVIYLFICFGKICNAILFQMSNMYCVLYTRPQFQNKGVERDKEVSFLSGTLSLLRNMPFMLLILIWRLITKTIKANICFHH